MGQKRRTPEQIIRKLREAEVAIAKGQPTAEVARKLGITEQTYYPVAQHEFASPGGGSRSNISGLQRGAGQSSPS